MMSAVAAAGAASQLVPHGTSQRLRIPPVLPRRLGDVEPPAKASGGRLRLGLFSSFCDCAKQPDRKRVSCIHALWRISDYRNHPQEAVV